mgnify:CR=1 FL=1
MERRTYFSCVDEQKCINVQITIWRESNVSNDQFSINEPVLFNVSCHCNRTVDRKDQDRQFFTGSSGGIFTGIVIGYFVTKMGSHSRRGTEVLQYSEKDPFYRCGCTGFLYFLSAAFSCFHRNEGRRKYRCHF